MDRGPPRRRSSDTVAAELARRFADALAGGDSQAAQLVVDVALVTGLGVAEIQARMIAPAMRVIGERWQHAELTIGDEHLATAITQEILGRLFLHALHAPPGSREPVLLTAVEGEQHVLGLRMVGDILEGAGFDVRYLGADVPLMKLLAACRAVRPAAIGFTVTMPLHLDALVREIEAVRGLERAPAVIAGGGAVTPSIAADLGLLRADSSEVAVRAVEEAVRHRADVAAVHPSLVAVPAAVRAAEPTTSGPIAGQKIETDEQAFSTFATAAAEAARDAARHAFAMEQLAYRDPLTGLWNRRAYDDRFHELKASSAKPGGMVLMVDVDGFKHVNDTAGHEAGDATLRNIGEVLLRSVRAVDFVARYGGDEFAILLPGAAPEEALAMAERIRASVAERANKPAATVSVGGAPTLDDRRRTMLVVDQALYEAKRAGGDRIAIPVGG